MSKGARVEGQRLRGLRPWANGGLLLTPYT